MNITRMGRSLASALVLVLAAALAAPAAGAVETVAPATEPAYYEEPVLRVSDVDRGDTAELEILWGGEGDVDRLALMYSYRGAWWPMPGQDRIVYDGASTWTWAPVATREYAAVAFIEDEAYLLDTFTVAVRGGPSLSVKPSRTSLSMGSNVVANVTTTRVSRGTPVTMTEYNDERSGLGAIVEQSRVRSGAARLVYAPGTSSVFSVCADLGEGYEACDRFTVSVSGTGVHADTTPSYVTGMKMDIDVYSTTWGDFRQYHSDPADRCEGVSDPLCLGGVDISDPDQVKKDRCMAVELNDGACLVSLAVKPRSGREFKVLAVPSYRGTDTIVPHAVNPELTLLQSTSFTSGDYVELTVMSTVPFTGTGWLYRKDPGGSWVRTKKTVSIRDGWGSVEVKPKGARQYEVRVAGYRSAGELPTPAGLELSVDGPPVVAAGTPAVLSVTMDGPSWATKGAVYYRDGDGPWKRSSLTFRLSDGVARVEVTPREGRQYQVRVKDVTSEVFAPEVISVELGAQMEEPYVPGERATLSAWSSPAYNGAASVWFRDDGGAWHRTSRDIELVDGAGEISATPRLGREYQVRLGSASSEVLSPVAAELDFQVASTSYVPGGRVVLAVAVDPAVTMVAAVEFRDPGGVWRVSSHTIDLVDGEGSVGFRGREGREYRITVAGQSSAPYEPGALVSEPELETAPSS